MKIVHPPSTARADIRTILNYLERELGSRTIRQRFLVSFETTCELLATHPGIGRCEDLVPPATEEVHRFPVEHFDRYLIFYTVSQSTVHVTRVLHGARDPATRLTYEVS